MGVETVALLWLLTVFCWLNIVPECHSVHEIIAYTTDMVIKGKVYHRIKLMV